MRVFISSPYSGLESEREAVASILSGDHSIVGMEDFGSSGLPPLSTCLDALRTCEACVLVLAGRYGSRVPEIGISYTEAEFEFAQANGIRVFAYVAEGFDDLVEEADQTEADRISQREFAAKCERELVVDQERFSDPDELASAARCDLERWAGGGGRPRFSKARPEIDRALAYAGKKVARTTARLYPMPVILVDVGAAHLQNVPPPQGSRIARKVHEISRDLNSKEVPVVIFNEIPVNDTRDASEFEQRLAALTPSPGLIVCIVGKESELELLERFAEAGAERVLWKPDSMDFDDNGFDAAYVAGYTSEELSKCAVALAIEKFVDETLDERAIGTLIESRN